MKLEPEVVFRDGKLQNKITNFKCMTGKWSNFIKDKIYEPYTCKSRKDQYGEWVNCDFKILDEDNDEYSPKGGFKKIITYEIKASLTDNDKKQIKRVKQRVDSLENNGTHIDTFEYLRRLYDAYRELEHK